MGTAARGYCWNIGNSHFEIHIGTNLVSGGDLQTEFWDAYGGARLLLEHRLGSFR